MFNRTSTGVLPAVAALTLFVSCERIPSGPDSAARNAGLLEAPPVIHGFAIDLAVEGSVRLNTPLRITGRVHSTSTNGVLDVRILMPEYQIAEATRWAQPYHVPVGRQHGVVASAHGSAATVLSAQKADIIFRLPGIYRVVAIVARDATDGVPVDLSDKFGAREIWIAVTDTSGSVHDSFPAHLIPEAYATQPGPFRTQRGATPTSSVTLRPSAMLLNDEEEVTVITYDPLHDTHVNVPNLMVNAYDWDGQYQQEYFAGQYTTDANGVAVLPCPTYSYSGIARFVTQGGIAAVDPRNVGEMGFGGLGQCSTSQYEVYSAVGLIYYYYQSIIPASQSAFSGFSHPFANVTYQSNAVSSHYTPSTGVITIKYPDYYFPSTLAHEYGHAFHYETLGTVATGTCVELPHYVWGTIHDCYESPWIEGFAGWYNNTLLPEYASGYEFGPRNLYVLDDFPEDGARMEGLVSSVLWDLTDGIGGLYEDHDSVQVSATWLVSMVQNCRVTVGGQSIRPRGIDDFMHCVGNQLDSEVTSGSFFPLRTQDATAQSNGMTGHPSLTNLRRIWKKDLYWQ